MAEYSGVIGRIGEKHWQGKTFYSLVLRGQEGWHNLGVKRPPAIGTSVKFYSSANAKGFLTVDGSIEITADGAAAPAAGVKEVSKGSSVSKDDYWNRKEERDLHNDTARELGASRNTAIAIIDLALRNEIVKLPAAAKREEFMWTLLNKYTDKLMGKDGQTHSEEVKESEPQSNDPQGDNWN